MKPIAPLHLFRLMSAMALIGLLLLFSDSSASGSAAAWKQPAARFASDAAHAKAARLAVMRTFEGRAYLADAHGRALYLFKADTSEASTCYDACAEAWPPFLTEGTPQAEDAAVQRSLIGTLERRGGGQQVTYDARPLYYYAWDEGAEHTRGQDLEGFGAEWYLVAPSGRALETER